MRRYGGAPEEETGPLGAEEMGLWNQLLVKSGVETGGTMPGMSGVTGAGKGADWGAGMAALGAGLSNMGKDSGPTMSPMGPALPFSRAIQTPGPYTPTHRRRQASDDIDISRVMSLLTRGGR